jgi:hypothetical protein
MPGTLNEARKQRIDDAYAELRAIDPDERRSCVERAVTISANHRLCEVLPGDKLVALLADIEYALVESALRNRRKGGD